MKQYHEWMQSAELLELTESEPLSIEEEMENMRSWRGDNNKLTFIILDTSIARTFMAGDVNLYMLPDSEYGGIAAEIEVMIAEKTCRRKRLAQMALTLMMAYATKYLSVQVFVAKILDHNLPSISLFTKVMHFEEHRKVPAFNEIHYRLNVVDQVLQNLENARNSWIIQSFSKSPFATVEQCGKMQ